MVLAVHTATRGIFAPYDATILNTQVANVVNTNTVVSFNLVQVTKTANLNIVTAAPINISTTAKPEAVINRVVTRVTKP